MKNKLKQTAIFILCIAIGFEAIHLAFWLMNQPSTPLFWLGILMLTGIASLAGTYIWKRVDEWLDSKMKDSNENDITNP